MNAIYLEKNNHIVKFSFEVDAEEFEKGLKYSYNKNKDQISIPGFRKGKAPRKLIEAQHGENFFYEDAIDFVFPDAYESAVKELALDVVSQPNLDIESIDKATGIKFLISVTVKPEVTLGKYKGLEIEKVEVETTDEEVMAELKKEQEKNARTVEVTDRPAQMNDIVNISYAGSVDGVAFEGGQADSHDLPIGSHMFIEGFEEQIIGHSIGEKFDVNVTFPTEYHAPDLAGKEAVFAVEVKGISEKELPALDDTFAEDVSDFSTLDEYKASILEKLSKEKEEKAKQIQGDKLLDAALENCTMDVPEVMYNNKVEQLMHDFEENISKQGLTIEIYCQYLGTTVEQMKENFKDTAVKSVNARLMLEQIAKEENIVISKEQLEEEIGKFGESCGLEASKMIEMFRPEDREAMEHDLTVHEALKIMEDSAVIIEPKAE